MVHAKPSWLYISNAACTAGLPILYSCMYSTKTFTAAVLPFPACSTVISSWYLVQPTQPLTTQQRHVHVLMGCTLHILLCWIHLRCLPACLHDCLTDDGAAAIPFPLYLLGQDQSNRWTFALDISAARDPFLDFLSSSCELEVVMRDLRVLLPGLSLDACAIAGQATALSQWHQVQLGQQVGYING